MRHFPVAIQTVVGDIALPMGHVRGHRSDPGS
jgi:hypothetical protein